MTNLNSMPKKEFTYKDPVINVLLETNDLGHMKYKLSYLQTFNIHEV